MKSSDKPDQMEEIPITSISFRTTEGNKTGSWRSQRPVLDAGKCNRCGLCWMYCPDNAVRVRGNAFTIDYKYCKGCGICAEECPKQAISMEKERR